MKKEDWSKGHSILAQLAETESIKKDVEKYKEKSSIMKVIFPEEEGHNALVILSDELKEEIFSAVLKTLNMKIKRLNSEFDSL